MKPYFLPFLVIAILGGCTTHDQPTPIPSLKAVNPQFAAVGTIVVVSGAGFSSTPSDNKITFNEVPASIQSASDTSLTVTVPTGAFSDELRSAAVVVTTKGKTGSPFYLRGDNYPEITSINPRSGPVGTLITIRGRNFNPTVEGSSILFWGGPASGRGNPLATPLSASSTAIRVQVPAGTGTGDACLITYVVADKSKYLSTCEVFTVTP